MKFGAIGRSEMLYETIQKCIKDGHKLAWIITAKPADEYKIKETDFENLAKKLKVPFLSINKITENNINEIIKLKDVDVCLSVNYFSVIPEKFISNFKYGIFNAHAGDLPKYKGNAPIAWAILNAETNIVLCIHKMIGEELDSGDIINKISYQINLNTRIGEIQNWVNKKIPMLFSKSLFDIENENIKYEKQNHKDGFRCFPRLPEDGKINWSLDNESIIRLINASSEPYSGAYCFYNNKKVIIWRAKKSNKNFTYLSTNGQIFLEKGKVFVITGDGIIQLLEVSVGDYRGNPNEIFKSIRIKLK
jgi:UDP-4-amino-4-deoxy-L-arabinose formyltransferase/UDP-glucuronic acid dehydrogenase (UDP-4-keto-hexauronic acid decarboxylating)